MKRIYWTLCILSALAFSAAAQQQPKRPMTVDDALNMVNLGNALISPDGEWVLYSRSELDWKKNKRKVTYHRVPSQGGESYQFIGEGGANSVQFSPQGTYLSFLRSAKEDGSPEEGRGDDRPSQIFVMRTQGGEAVQLTRHKGRIRSYAWSEDESRIFFNADKARGKDEKERRKKGHDAIFVDEGPNGQSEGRWRNLWVIGLEDKEEARLTDEPIRIGDFDVSPDGKRILYTARSENRRNQRYLSEIHLLDIASQKSARLTENRAPESNPAWSPDGRSFAYTAPDDKEWELRNDKIWLMDLATRKYRMASKRFEGNIQRYFWAPDSKSLLFTGLQGTDSNLYRLEVESGRVEQLTQAQGSLRVSSFSKDRSRYAYLYSDPHTPPDLYSASLRGGKPARLTEANPWVEKDLLLARAQTIRWKSSDGLEIEGLFYLPAGYQEGTRVPLMLNIHGGPAGVFRRSFEPRHHIYGGLGYASLSPNVRGSSGYSDELLRGNMRDIGGGDYQDLMTGVDHLIQAGFADPQRLGLRGWSYGGILGGWTITQTNRFKAASIGAMVSDWTSEYGPGFNFDVRLWYIGATPWENPQGYRQKSALTHVHKAQTPTIIFHGMNDTTDTEAQSMMFFQALKDLGRQVRYLRFPREPHGFREPRHQRIRDIEEIQWMQKYILGEDWQPWERPQEEDEDEEKKKEAEVEVGSN
ncbi:MAG: S9 family peptidase, partial [Acidobacteriota bacterium]